MQNPIRLRLKVGLFSRVDFIFQPCAYPCSNQLMYLQKQIKNHSDIFTTDSSQQSDTKDYVAFNIITLIMSRELLCFKEI